ncbi:MAG: histidine phosphatase family protein [Acidobacteriaceae bacterium]|nr:histidine phosphatase family protein [Acidobacteriaceae bacterium]
MIRILLIRHGETMLLGQTLYGRLPGIRLSPNGYCQAEELAKSLKRRFEITEVVSSPMERTQETAGCIAGVFGVPVLLDANFIELNFGSWTGKRFDELKELEAWKLYNRHRSIASPPEGESLAEVQRRAWIGLEHIQARFEHASETTVAVVTHGDVIRSALMLLLGMPGDFIHRIEVGPGSVSEVVFYGMQARVISINCAP